MSLPVRRVAPWILVLSGLLAACGGGGGGGGGGGAPVASADGGSSGTGLAAPVTSDAPAEALPVTTEPPPSGAIDTIDALNGALEAQYGSADWFGDIVAITEETLLGAPVVLVHTTLSVSDPDFEAVNRKRTEIGDALASLDQVIAPNLAMLDGDQSLAAIASGGLDSVPMGDAFALPERPETAAAVRAWLDAVYGPGGLVTLGPDEAWLETVTDIRFEDPGWGTGNVLWVETSLPTYRSLDAQLLQKAVNTTGSSMVGNWYLETADGTGASVAAPGLKDVPVGSDGFFYMP